MTMPMTMIRNLARGLAALTALAAALAGVPAVLVAIGAFPTGPITGTQLWSALSRPDDSGQVLFAVLAAAVWACWAAFTISVLRELAAAVTSRGARSAGPVGGLDWAGRPAAILVAAVVGAFVAAPVVTTLAPTSAYAAPTGQSTTAAGVPGGGPGAAEAARRHTAKEAPTGTTATAGQERAAPRRYTVRRHDTLWAIAERELGDPMRYREIRELNPNVGPDARLLAGMTLTLPPTAHQGSSAQVVTVVAGDTLSQIAAEHGIGDWHRIWPVNKDTPQPGGATLTDPDHIEPGWSIAIPATAVGKANGSDHRTAHRAPAVVDVPAPARPAPPAPEHREVLRDDDTQRPAPAPGAAALPAPSAGASSLTARPRTTSTTTNNGEVAVEDSTPLGAVFAGAGAILAVGVLGGLTLLRRQQFRARRPGRSISTTPAPLVPIERTVARHGNGAAAAVGRLDRALRALSGAVQHDPDLTIPDIVAVQLRDNGEIVLHLGAPSTPAIGPWRASEDGMRWHLQPAPQSEGQGEQESGSAGPAPFPMLVAIGSSEHGAWLLDLERAGAIGLHGDPTRCEDFARFVGAELARNSWGQGLNVVAVGFGPELVGLGPDRVRHTDDLQAAVHELTLGGVDHADTARALGTTAPQARAAGLGDDAWTAEVLLVGGHRHLEADPEGQAALYTLVDLVLRAPSRTALAVLIGTEQSSTVPGLTRIEIDSAGILTLPDHELSMVAVQLDEQDATGMGQMLAAARVELDEPMPVATGRQPWQAYADSAGALRQSLTTPRQQGPEPAGDRAAATSILPLPDEAYLARAATTPADLSALAPRVTPDLRSDVEGADPTLDQEVAIWFAPGCPLPRLSLLGPVELDARGFEEKVGKQRAYFTELAAYLGTREHGATPDEVAADFNVQPAKARANVGVLRDWLGVNPLTGAKHLPDANKSLAARRRGVGVYQIEGMLVDADLMRRLRLRAQARGSQGMPDLLTALSLVKGRPLSQLRTYGYEWLLEVRLEHHLVCAVVDVAHLVTVHMLATGDTDRARAAAEIAALAAPYEETPRLDLAAVCEAEGHPDTAERLVREQVCNRSDDGRAPTELSARTQQILHQRDWGSQAS